MPWVHFDMTTPEKGRLTNDDGNEIGIITGMQIEYTRDPLLMGRCEIEILITDMDQFPVSMGFDKKPA